MYRFTVKVEKRAEGYVIIVPAVPGCVTSGRTREEAFRKAREVLQAILIQAGPCFPLSAIAPHTGDEEFVDVSAPSVQSC